MKKKGIFLPQETNETCGISCILMVLTAFGKIRKPKPSLLDERSTESSLYDQYGCRATKGTLGSAIAYALSVRRLKVELWHESENLLDNRGQYYPQDLYEKMLSEHREYINRGNFEVRAGVKIDADVLAELLNGERMLIVQCLIDGDADGMHDKVMHWIVVFDFVGGKFRAYDPQYVPPSSKAPNYIEITPEEMNGYMDTPLGASLIMAEEKKC